MFDIVTFGGATRDIFLKTSEGVILPNEACNQEKMLSFKYGQKILTDEAHFNYGGGAFNAAISFAKLGLNTAPCVNVGEDESSHSIVTTLKSLNVDTSFVGVDLDNHTALSIIVIDKGEHIAFLHRGANDFLRLKNQDEMENTKWFYIASLTGSSDAVLPDILKIASDNKIKIAFNPGSTQLKKGYRGLKNVLEHVDILSLNKEEAEELVGSIAHSELESERALMLELLKMGPKSVVMTDGVRGSYYADKENIIFEDSFGSGRAVDTTGAGDAFGSTFLACVIKGLGRKESLRLAAANSANVVKYIGAQTGLMTMKEIRESLARDRKAKVT